MLLGDEYLFAYIIVKKFSWNPELKNIGVSFEFLLEQLLCTFGINQRLKTPHATVEYDRYYLSHNDRRRFEDCVHVLYP